jgi:hypothetical protein
LGYVANAPVNVAQFGGSNGTFSSGRPEVNASHWGGTAVGSTEVRANLINIAGVAVSTTTAQLGVNVVQLSTDATAADNAEAFFDGTGYAGTGNVIPTVTTLTGHTAQTGDNFARLGAPAGVSVSADIAAVKTDTGNWVTRITSTLFSGITSLAQWMGLIAGKQVGNTTARTELRATGAGSGTFDETTDSLEANRDNIGTAGAGLTAADDAVITLIGVAGAGLTDLGGMSTTMKAQVEAEVDDALGGGTGTALTAIPWNAAWDAEVQSECADALVAYDGLVAADLPTNFSSLAINASGHVVLQDASLVTAKLGTFALAKTTNITGFNDITAAGVVTAMGTGTFLTAIPWNASWDAEVQSEVIDALQETVPDTVPADGSRPNVQQAARMILQTLTDFVISSTTLTVRKEDGSTTLMTLTLNDATSPSGVTRAS